MIPQREKPLIFFLVAFLLSSAGAGRNCARPVRLPDHSPALSKIVHPWVQKFYPVLGLGSGEKHLWHFHLSSSVLDKFQSAKKIRV